MNAYYHRFLTVEITHSYFESGISQSFELQPFQDTITVLKNHRILLRKERNRFAFYAGSNDQDNFDIATELSGLGLLQFQLLNNDPLFTTYTSNVPMNMQGTLYIKNVADKNELQMDFGPANEQTDINAIGVVLLDTQPLVAQNNPELTLSLSFTTRELLWEYQFVIPESRNMEVSNLQIEGIGNENYVGPVDGTLMETQKTKVMTSDRPVALTQKLSKYPTLKLNYLDTITNSAKELEMKLPNPSPESIRTELRDGALIPYLVTTIVYV
ncbi:hypothetical protein J1N09_04295 [Aureitalea sp. L0-47]|uniref:hypothetical protein n=1 Tax=Aureitalea sp. L0-47 TaxID=2816962 RepID=UPI00223858F9|nr:hypothetical protein [Aureitalea sp. L0-47]MCW5519045.1 hypothetical protein [Aureitalea sp. L0-47]